MVFLLSIRRCRFYLEEWTKDRKRPGRKIRGSSKPPTEVFGFHQTLKKKQKKTKKTKQSEKKNSQATHAIKGSTGLIWKVSKSHLEKKPCDALSTPNVRLQLSSKAAGTSTWTYLCKIFLPRITAWTERFKSGWRERQKDSIVRSQTHKKDVQRCVL